MPALTIDVHDVATRPRRARQGGYLSKTCPEKVAKDNMPNTYPVELQVPSSPFMTDLANSGIDFEEHIGNRLLAEGAPGTVAMIDDHRDSAGERTTEGKRAKEADTFAAYLDPKVEVIFNARIGATFERLLSQHLGTDVADPDRISEPDAIVLGARLANGLRAMYFVDVKWHKLTSGTSKTPKTLGYSTLGQPSLHDQVGSRDFYGALEKVDWLQLSHYYRHGTNLGLTLPGDEGAWAGVIGKDEIVAWSNLHQMTFQSNVDGRRVHRSPVAIYQADWADNIAVLDNALARDIDPDTEKMSWPEMSDACRECPWRTVCLQEMETFGDGGHVTLLQGVTPLRATRLYDEGIYDAGTLAAQPLVTEDGRPSPFQSYIQQARTTISGVPHRAAGCAEVDIPRGDIEVDFDCESDDIVYMWGVRIERRTGLGTVELVTFDDYTGSEDAELNVFVAAWTLFTDLAAEAAAAGQSIRFYHYTLYERTQMLALAKRYAGMPGVPTQAQVEDFFDTSGAVVDLYALLTTQLVWPTRSNTIKKLAPYAGFTWRDEMPGGDMSMLWYRTACTDPDPVTREQTKARLRAYNGDDVHAQAHLRNWVGERQFESVELLAA